MQEELMTKNKEEFEAVQTLAKVVKETCEKIIAQGGFDRTVPGIVLSNQTIDGLVDVQVMGGQYTIHNGSSVIYKEGDSVWITVPCNDVNNMFINSIRTGEMNVNIPEIDLSDYVTRDELDDIDLSSYVKHSELINEGESRVNGQNIFGIIRSEDYNFMIDLDEKSLWTVPFSIDMENNIWTIDKDENPKLAETASEPVVVDIASEEVEVITDVDYDEIQVVSNVTKDSNGDLILDYISIPRILNVGHSIVESLVGYNRNSLNYAHGLFVGSNVFNGISFIGLDYYQPNIKIQGVGLPEAFQGRTFQIGFGLYTSRCVPYGGDTFLANITTGKKDSVVEMKRLFNGISTISFSAKLTKDTYDDNPWDGYIFFILAETVNSGKTSAVTVHSNNDYDIFKDTDADQEIVYMIESPELDLAGGFSTAPGQIRSGKPIWDDEGKLVRIDPANWDADSDVLNFQQKFGLYNRAIPLFPTIPPFIITIKHTFFNSIPNVSAYKLITSGVDVRCSFYNSSSTPSLYPPVRYDHMISTDSPIRNYPAYTYDYNSTWKEDKVYGQNGEIFTPLTCGRIGESYLAVAPWFTGNTPFALAPFTWGQNRGEIDSRYDDMGNYIPGNTFSNVRMTGNNRHYMSDTVSYTHLLISIRPFTQVSQEYTCLLEQDGTETITTDLIRSYDSNVSSQYADLSTYYYCIIKTELTMNPAKLNYSVHSLSKWNYTSRYWSNVYVSDKTAPTISHQWKFLDYRYEV